MGHLQSLNLMRYLPKPGTPVSCSTPLIDMSPIEAMVKRIPLTLQVSLQQS